MASPKIGPKGKLKTFFRFENGPRSTVWEGHQMVISTKNSLLFCFKLTYRFPQNVSQRSVSDTDPFWPAGSGNGSGHQKISQNHGKFSPKSHIFFFKNNKLLCDINNKSDNFWRNIWFNSNRKQKFLISRSDSEQDPDISSYQNKTDPKHCSN